MTASTSPSAVEKVIIIGSGPAAHTAAIYLARKNVSADQLGVILSIRLTPPPHTLSNA